MTSSEKGCLNGGVEQRVAFNATHTDRSLQRYETLMGFSRDFLNGKKILDLGSGFLGRFGSDVEKECKEGTSVVSLDYVHRFSRNETSERQYPFCIDLYNPEDVEQVPPKQNKAVAGLFSNLPFKDDTFDVIISLFAFPYYSNSKELSIKVLEELVRTIKPKGTIMLWPVSEAFIQTVKEMPSKNKVWISWEPISDNPNDIRSRRLIIEKTL